VDTVIETGNTVCTGSHFGREMIRDSIPIRVRNNRTCNYSTSQYEPLYVS
jgi:hypothetical protein